MATARMKFLKRDTPSASLHSPPRGRICILAREFLLGQRTYDLWPTLCLRWRHINSATSQLHNEEAIVQSKLGDDIMARMINERCASAAINHICEEHKRRGRAERRKLRYVSTLALNSRVLPELYSTLPSRRGQQNQLPALNLSNICKLARYCLHRSRRRSGGAQFSQSASDVIEREARAAFPPPVSFKAGVRAKPGRLPDMRRRREPKRSRDAGLPLRAHPSAT